MDKEEVVMSEINTWIDDAGVRCCNYTDHQRIIAEKDEEIEKLREAIGWLIGKLDEYHHHLVMSGKDPHEVIHLCWMKSNPCAGS